MEQDEMRNKINEYIGSYGCTPDQPTTSSWQNFAESRLFLRGYRSVSCRRVSECGYLDKFAVIRTFEQSEEPCSLCRAFFRIPDTSEIDMPIKLQHLLLEKPSSSYGCSPAI